jgi:GGDEF domain-containing protein
MISAELINNIRNLSIIEVANLVYRDPLTGLLNRRAFEASRASMVALIDMDSLKWVNDNLGHRQGDRYLKELGTMLSTYFSNDRVFRIAGDEFAVNGTTKTSLWESLSYLQETLTHFSFGVGRNLEEADKFLILDRNRREKSGARAPRGEAPRWGNFGRAAK